MSLTGFLSYSRVNWKQLPDKSTPLSAANLNAMDAGIKNNNDMISNLRDEVAQLNSNIGEFKVYPYISSATQLTLPPADTNLYLLIFAHPYKSKSAMYVFSTWGEGGEIVHIAGDTIEGVSISYKSSILNIETGGYFCMLLKIGKISKM